MNITNKAEMRNKIKQYILGLGGNMTYYKDEDGIIRFVESKDGITLQTRWEIAKMFLEEIGIEAKCINVEEIPLSTKNQVIIRFSMGALLCDLAAWTDKDDKEKMWVELYIEYDYPNVYRIPAGEDEIGTRIMSIEI